MSFCRGKFNGKSDPLNKRIPENPRYAHVEHVVDSGASITKYFRQLEEIKQNYRYRKDEIFKRLKPTTFAQLILQVELHNDLEDEEEKENETAQTQTPTPRGEGDPDSIPRATLNSVISGMGELDIKEMHLISQCTPAPPPPVPPYIVLDVRDKEDYEQAHIVGAKHYPPAMLNRSCNFFTKDILEYKNKPGKIIILYDEDERIAPHVASTFVQREVDNVFMLSGGLKVLHKLFPDCVITGQVPSTCLPTPRKCTSSGSVRQSRSSERIAPCSNRIPQVGSADLKEAFTEEDLDKIQNFLDSALLADSGRNASALSSRASSRSSASSISNTRSHSSTSNFSIASNRTTSSTKVTPPWK